MHRRHRTVHWAAAIAATLTLLPARGNAAETPPPATPLILPTARTPGAAGPVPEAGCRISDCERSRPKRRFDFGGRPQLGATLVEIPAPSAHDEWRRPRYALGVRSPQLESALNTVGITARHCLAPVVRANTKISGALGLRGTLWISLRCSFE